MQRIAARFVYILVLMLTQAAAGQATVIYVDEAATGTPNGDSWTTAWTSLHDGLDDAATSPPPVLVKVARGRYVATNGSPFFVPAQTTVRGGYFGNTRFGDSTTLDPDSRVVDGRCGQDMPIATAFYPDDIPLYLTILDGDVAGNDNPSCDGGPCSGSDPDAECCRDHDGCLPLYEENAYQIIRVSPNDLVDGHIFDVVLDSLVIANANSLGTGPDFLAPISGAALYVNRGGGTPQTGCHFTCHVLNCAFIRNINRSGRGGAVYAENGSSIRFTQCYFENNIVIGNVGPSQPIDAPPVDAVGGAVCLNGCSPAAMAYKLPICTPVACPPGEDLALCDGNLCCDQKPIFLDRCMFRGNRALAGIRHGRGGDFSEPDRVWASRGGAVALIGEGGSTEFRVRYCDFDGNAYEAINAWWPAVARQLRCRYGMEFTPDLREDPNAQLGGGIYAEKGGMIIGSSRFGNLNAAHGAGLCSGLGNMAVLNSIVAQCQGSGVCFSAATGRHYVLNSTIARNTGVGLECSELGFVSSDANDACNVPGATRLFTDNLYAGEFAIANSILWSNVVPDAHVSGSRIDNVNRQVVRPDSGAYQFTSEWLKGVYNDIGGYGCSLEFRFDIDPEFVSVLPFHPWGFVPTAAGVIDGGRGAETFAAPGGSPVPPYLGIGGDVADVDLTRNLGDVWGVPPFTSEDLPWDLARQCRIQGNEIELGAREFAGVCVIDIDDDGIVNNGNFPDGGVDINDLILFLRLFELGDTLVDFDDDGDPDKAHPDGGVDISDFLYFLAHFELGC